MGSDPPIVEISRWVSPPGGAADGGHGPKNSAGQDVGVLTHLGGAGNGGAIGYQVIYILLIEHGCAIHYNLSYHELVFGGGEEASNRHI